MNIAVIGAGIAGAAAAFEASRQGARPTVFHDLAGSSALYSGALDLEPWDHAAAVTPLSPELLQFSAELGAWALSDAPCRVATLEGNVRPARGRDRACLDLERCAGGRVAVVDVERDDWDAPLLARSFAASPWARKSQTQFFPVRVTALQKGFERRISSYDFAALHDDPERVRALLGALRDSAVTPDAWLLGPWLGIAEPVAGVLSEALGVPVGETTAALGGSAGARFEIARDRLLGQIAQVERRRVTRLQTLDRLVRLELRDGGTADFDAVVLATGGVAAGGVALERSFERRGGTGFRLSVAGPLPLELDGEILEGVSSLSNVDFSERGLRALLEVGIGAQNDGAVSGNPGVFAAGDAIAARPRTALAAASSGLVAARSALDYVWRLT